IPSAWGNASTIDRHEALYIGGAQRNSGAHSAALIFANWGYFTNSGTGTGGLDNATAQGDAVKFEIANVDVGGEFSQRLAFRARNASATNVEAMSIVSSGNIGIGTTSPRANLHTVNTGGNEYDLVQGNAGGGGTAFGPTDTIPISSGNGFDGYNGLALIPSAWGNASTIDRHEALYIGGAQRNSGAHSAALIFANWGY